MDAVGTGDWKLIGRCRCRDFRVLSSDTRSTRLDLVKAYSAGVAFPEGHEFRE